MLVWEIEARRDLANLVLINAEIVPFPENHADVGTAHIPKSRVNAGTVRACTDKLIVV